MVLIYYKVKNIYGWHYDNYKLVISGNKPSVEELESFNKKIVKQWGASPVIINIIELEE